MSDMLLCGDVDVLEHPFVVSQLVAAKSCRMRIQVALQQPGVIPETSPDYSLHSLIYKAELVAVGSE